MRRAAFAAIVLLSGTGAALAHGAERGFVLLMPTGWAVAGGAAAVAASFVAVALAPDRLAERAMSVRAGGTRMPALSVTATSTASALLLLVAILAGMFGIRDPLTNPLPLLVWTVFWVALPLAHVLFGNLWAALNPFVGPYRLLDRATGGRLSADARPLPEAIGYLPAILTFLAFAWFELVYPAPEDPERLAVAVAVYLVLGFALLVTYGEAWLERGDPFSVFFRLVATLAPLAVVTDGAGRRRLELAMPGARLAEREPLPWSGTVFVLLTLATVSFDGLSATFWYLGVAGINPLEYPGRTAMLTFNTAGLLAAAAALVLLFVAPVALGRVLSGATPPVRDIAGRLVLSVVPISVAFHFAHYLTALLVNGQFAVQALDDPFGLGWSLLGVENHHVTVSFLQTRAGTIAIWAVQTTAVVAGHVLAVAVAHGLLAGWRRDLGRTVLLEAPLAIAMVAYTAFGLWLLSSPVAH